jgi:hypothetical protein
MNIVTFNKKNIKRFVTRRGRIIIVSQDNSDTMWKYTIGKRGRILAFSELGHRVMGEAWILTGCSSPDVWSRDINRNHSTYASVTPRIICEWLMNKGDII